VFSYLWLRGKCRYCGTRIPQRILWVELSTGILFAFLFWRYGLTLELPLIAFYTCILFVLAVIDLRHKLILNVIVYPVSMFALLFGYYEVTWQLTLFSLYFATLLILVIINLGDNTALSVIIYPGIAIAIIMEIFIPGIGDLKGLLGGAIGFAILMIPTLVSRTGMGWGDVKMAGLIGLMTGYPRVFVGLLGGIILGGVTAVILIILRKKSRKDTIPFGPFLALGAFLALIYGQEIIDWYLALFL
jgi:leader peptidase (prepilin peptidase)/N-methyltransferase